MGKKEEDSIIVKGARTHNLKNVTIKIPRNKMVVFTGISGSGKSSLAFDTIFAEGQRRYVESLSSYARQFLNQMQKPDVDEIAGLSPAISIDQKSRSNNPRSTVATITEIYDYLRILFARVAGSHHGGVSFRRLYDQGADRRSVRADVVLCRIFRHRRHAPLLDGDDLSAGRHSAYSHRAWPVCATGGAGARCARFLDFAGTARSGGVENI